MGKMSLEDLKEIKEKTRAAATPREGGFRAKVNIHMGTCGLARGARQLMNAVEEEIRKRDMRDILIVTSGCAGLCSREPMITVEVLGQDPVKYVDLDPDKMREIFEGHVVGGKMVEKYALGIGSESES
ncbi:MAG TPA: (2Fe-2S) ferredoxin domain-containing protein [Thermodesulfobacteriota bacterium]|nr:(2Fe-2S) ferredoxin domain-containing protein [Thermodesulfobacteriota bacterium]